MNTRYIGLIGIWMLLLPFLAGAQNATHDSTVQFKVYGVCDQCKQRIETAVKGKGVVSADWNVDTKMLTLTYEPNRINLDKIHNRITAAGHDTYLKKASDADYNKLPSCCRYRELLKQNEAPAGQATSAPSGNNQVTGVVLSEDQKGHFTPLSGASVLWLGTTQGTTSDATGTFALPPATTTSQLVISYSGYHPDTVFVTSTDQLKVILASGNQLKEIRVTGNKPLSYINSYDPFRAVNITRKELFKAACCNLSESFETNPSVDVSYNDAITGSKQIQLLGLAGSYTQLTVENLPGPRGLATPMGLNFIPGSWIESLQLIKGPGSVANGFESIAGQINVELKKPMGSEPLFVNLYTNDQGRTEMNLNASQKVGKNWNTEILVHDDFLANKNLDDNKDGFRDLPTGNLFTAENRWSFDNNKGWMSQWGARLLTDDRTGGQLGFDPAKDRNGGTLYGLGILNRRYEAFGKTGYVFPEKKYTSIGLQLSAFNQEEHSYYGLTTYDGTQKNLYANLIYQSIIGSSRHKFRTGLSMVYDQYDEALNTQPYVRTETVPGGFFEYTYSPNEKFDLVAGLREDHNNLYGWFTTPRLNVRYEPVKGTIIRLSGGRGQRTANIFAENSGIFASSRQIQILPSVQGKAYGLNPEVAWNKGIAVDQQFHLFQRKATLGVEYFRNDFVNQVVLDLEDPRKAVFYNLQGQSYSNSFQTELSVEPLRRLTLKLAYRLFDVKTTYGNQLLERPLTSKDRGFASLDYEWKGWKLDYTVNYNGTKRIPSTAQNPVSYQVPESSPAFVLMNAQVSKTLLKKSNLSFYIGGENLTNYVQRNAIIAADQPFSEFFDASLVWGPVTGRMFYAGLRYNLP